MEDSEYPLVFTAAVTFLRAHVMKRAVTACLALALIFPFLGGTTLSQTENVQFPVVVEKDFLVTNFRFQNGQTLPEVRIHYRTLGTPIRDTDGRIRNGVLVLHGSSGDATQVLAASFSNPLFARNGPLDASRHFLILPDNIGNGKSTKPSDGLRANFPKYGYTDMVALQHRLVTEELGIARLRLVIGISMGGMHTWIWGTRYPDMMDALVPIAAMPSRIDGRSLVWRRILAQAIRNDPAWNDGNYTTPPRGFLSIMPMFDMLVQSPVRMGETITSYEKADAYLKEVLEETLEEDDANNILYRFESSFDYDVTPELEKVKARLLTILFADDELNPPELGIMERLMTRVRTGRMVLVPAGSETEGHRTQVKAEVWREFLSDFMSSLSPLR
jgi:homoserine O-acetyltransferase